MRGPNLSDDERHKLACILFENSVNFKPKRGMINTLAAQFQVHRKTVYEVWRLAKQQRQDGESLHLNSKMAGKVGRPCIEFPREAIMNAKKSDRTTIKNLSLAVGVSKSTIWTWIQKKKVKSHSSAMHPALTADNKYFRLNFVLSKLYFDQLLHVIKFKEAGNIIHLDEKWFNMSQSSARYYLADEELPPYRSCQTKTNITKVMFMAVCGRPVYGENKELVFDGKIGIFPFTFQEPAKRSSKNRPAGTIETKCVPSVNKEVTRAMLINHVIPAIKSKWPPNASKNIIIQQDNAPPHLKGNDPEFVEAATSDGFNIILTNQPPNSPDLNVLDLGFFNSIQSLQITKPAKSVDELLQNVHQAWDEEPAETLDDVWLSLQACMLETMKRKGHNDYKLPHLKKKAQRKQGTLPRNLTASEELTKECIQELMLAGKATNLEELITDIESISDHESVSDMGVDN